LPRNCGCIRLCSLSRFSCVVSSFRFRFLSLTALLSRIAGGVCVARLLLILRMAGCEPYAG
jgi:hypothetical protein